MSKLIYRSLKDTITISALTILQLPMYLRHPTLALIDLSSFFHYFFNRKAYFPDNDQFAYGELSLHSLQKILSTLNSEKYTTFLDLGSGKGKCCFYAHMKGYTSRGVELNPAFTSFSSLMNKLFFRNRITFIKGDFLSLAQQKADIVLLSPLCMDEQDLKSFGKKLVTTSRVVIAVGCPLPDVPVSRTMPCLTSWGITACYIHSSQ